MVRPTRVTNTIKDRRVAVGITQAQLAEAVGVSRQTINAIEAGKYSPTLELAMLVGVTLDTTLDSLFSLGHDEPK